MTEVRDFSLSMVSYNTAGIAPHVVLTSLPLPFSGIRYACIGGKVKRHAIENGTDFYALSETFFPATGFITKKWDKIDPDHQSQRSKSKYNPQTDKKRLIGSGLTALSAHQILQTAFEPFDETSGSDAGANKGVLFTRIMLDNGVEVDVYLTHLQAGRGEKKEAIRLSQISEIQGFVREHSPDDERPVILMGDMNMKEFENEERTLHTVTYNTLVDTDGVLDYSNDAPVKFLDIGRQIYTDPEENPLYTTVAKSRLDYILVRPGVNWDIVLEESDVRAKNWGFLIWPSDHYRVNGDFHFVRTPEIIQSKDH